MTNVERHRRHLSDTSLCSVCKSGEETIMHVLCDFQAVMGIWRRTVATGKMQLFLRKLYTSGSIET